MLTEIGPVDIDVPRDVNASFDPQIVQVRQRRLTGIAVESLNARYRRAIRARGHFPTEQAPMKCTYLVTRSLNLTGRGKARWAMRWKPALNAFAITFEGRITPTGN